MSADHETYIMSKDGDTEERNLVVRRMDINFSKKECQILNLTDVTSIMTLEREKEKYRMIKLLNTSVHHEMIAPLRA